MSDAAPTRVGPMGRVLGSMLGGVLSRLYRSVITRKNQAFDAGRGVVELDRPVVSIGNLSVGGTGKTPMVAHFIEVLRRAGRSPAIAMRGYAAARSGATHGSDEAAVYQRAFPDLPVVARPDRTQGLIELFATPEGQQIDCVVLDDGFQHRQIARQVDVVLIDASRPPFDDALLPQGWLREPVDSLRRAHAVVVTHAELAAPATLHRLDAEVSRLTGSRPIAICRHDWSDLAVFDRGQRPDVGVSSLRGRRVMAACAIGNPGAFIAACDRAVAELGHVEAFIRPDHDPFSPATVRRLVAAARSMNADAIIVTEKDWSKLMHAPGDDWPCPVLRPRLVLTFERGETELADLVLARLADAYARFAEVEE